MSKRNYPTVIVGKVFDRTSIPYVILEQLLNEEIPGLVVQCGETNYDRVCIGRILGKSDPYDDGLGDLVLVEDGDNLNSIVDMVTYALNSINLQTWPNEVKMYFRDSWG